VREYQKADAIGVCIQKEAILKYLGPAANKWISYSLASVSGSVLAVCSCTILPLFSGIYRMGAGIGPATAFLYAGPAINILAIILTARILGVELGIARAVCAILFSLVIGAVMHMLYRNKNDQDCAFPEFETKQQNILTVLGLFITMIAILVFANLAPSESTTSVYAVIHGYKWQITSFFGLCFSFFLMRYFNLSIMYTLLAIASVGMLSFVFSKTPEIGILGGTLAVILLLYPKEEGKSWLNETWFYAKLILPLLLAGVLVAGFLLGSPGSQGVIPSSWVSNAVGGNSIVSNFIASFIGAFMYFATLTEIPILQGLLENGMGKGPALALLLAGPALSLPNMLVIKSVLGTKKTITFVSLVILMATLSGILYGIIC
jgi:uncharacterized membrane protein YraQ (UPF0718 family)